MRNRKKWSCSVLILTACMLLVLGGITVLIDPFFHYHQPLPGLSYPIFDQRYQNDGIVKHFDYDAIITGTSMTENFLASEADALFGVTSVKVPFTGATFKEINDNLCRAVQANPDIKLVIRSLDGYMLQNDKDAMRTDAQYPDYLYDRNPLNDVSYVLNKTVLLEYSMKVLQHTASGQETTDFDRYSYWADQMTFGPDKVLQNYRWDGTVTPSSGISRQICQRVAENVRQNVVALAKDHPDIEFYYYFPPYSILMWHSLYKNGTLEQQVASYKIATEEILACDNIHLFSYFTDYAMITDLENYKDLEHHTAQINSQILQDMSGDVNRLTKENYEAHWQAVLDFYSSFDYAAHFAGYGYPVQSGGD